uniref:Uncharacterized protein n=1 Tax=Cryptomonas curvata TaxID=233186 RepID=A0A7S0LWJ3_9CRYP|mmetsp:Transcript_12388/g.26598  ORF Transcript_12388/g.26598 Transcript_12388/m.26598 type:complete len:112 (+) Transcript_12388:64-399(+)
MRSQLDNEFNDPSHANNFPESRKDAAINPCSTVSAHQSPSQSLQPPPLKFQRNSAKRAAATVASVGTTQPSQSVISEYNFYCLESSDDIPRADNRSISELIDDVLLMTNFN